MGRGDGDLTRCYYGIKYAADLGRDRMTGEREYRSTEPYWNGGMNKRKYGPKDFSNRKEGKKQRRGDIDEFYYHCIHDLMRDHSSDPNFAITLKYFKYKIVAMQSLKAQRIILEAQE
jgi:hypothetical protein